MSPQELLAEIQKLPTEEQRRLLETLARSMSGQPEQHPSASEDEAERILQAKGIISVPAPTAYTDEDENFEPEVIEGQPLSETIIEARR